MDIHHCCTVRLLDDSEPLTITFQKESKGQELFDQVCTSLDLLEKHFFGLRYIDNEKQRHWLDLTRPAYRQLKHVTPPILSFRVKYYPSSPDKIKEEITRYFLFLQLRRDLNRGRLLCSIDQAINLAAYIVQSEVGDFENDSYYGVDYITQLKLMPRESYGHEKSIADTHRLLRGHSPASVEQNFLNIASQLSLYGIDPHIVQDESGSQLHLGIMHIGIVTFQGPDITNTFQWSSIVRLSYESKNFIVFVKNSENTKKQTIHSFKCPTQSSCKNVWKCAVEQQCFFNLESAARASKVTSGGGLFRRHSTYRFSGRSEKEAYTESCGISRMSPTVRRSTLCLHSAGTYSLRTGSLPGLALHSSHDGSSTDVSILASPSKLSKTLSLPVPDHVDLKILNTSGAIELGGLMDDSIPEESTPVDAPKGSPGDDSHQTDLAPESDTNLSHVGSSLLETPRQYNDVNNIPDFVMPHVEIQPIAILSVLCYQTKVVLVAMIVVIIAVIVVYLNEVSWHITSIHIPFRAFLSCICQLWYS